MARRIVPCMILLASLAGCGTLQDSWINPVNWFGGDREERTTAPDVVTVRDTRPLVDQVVSARMEKVPDGVILHAVGLPATQGYWGADLVLDEQRSSPSRRIYQFRVLPPYVNQPVVTPASREIHAALFVSDQTLATVREVQVLGARNARVAGR